MKCRLVQGREHLQRMPHLVANLPRRNRGRRDASGPAYERERRRDGRH